MCDLLCHAMYQYIYILMLHIQLPESQCFTYPLLVMVRNQFLVTPPIHHRFSQHPLNWNPGKGLVWGFESRISPCNCSFYRFPTFEPSLERDMLPPPRDLYPLPYPFFGKWDFKRHFVATPIMLAILLSFHYVGNFS